MGMDVNVYKLLEPCTAEEADYGYRDKVRLFLTLAQLEKLRTKWPSLAAEQQEYFNAEKLTQDHKIPDDFFLAIWDMSLEKGWATYSHSLEQKPDILVEVNSSDYCGVADDYRVNFKVEVLGGLRKPFRGANTSASQDGDTLTLSVSNFNGTVEDQLTEIIGQDAMFQAYALLTKDDLPRLEALKNLCDYPAEWQSQVLDQMLESDCVTAIDW